MKTIIKVEKNRIEISKNLYEVFKRTVSNDPINDFLGIVHINRKSHVLVTTDGKQLFILDINRFDFSDNRALNYDPVKIRKKFYLIDANNKKPFPNYQKVIPDYEGSEYTRIRRGDSYEFDISNHIVSNSIDVYWLLKGINAPLNLDCILKTLKYIDPFQCFTSETGRSVVMTSTDCVYVIMPIQGEGICTNLITKPAVLKQRR